MANKFDISRYHEIADYIEMGSSTGLSEDELEYLEILVQMNNMRRRYGKNEAIRFFTNEPFNISLYRSKQMFEESINLFYSDEIVDKKAARNLKAEQLEQAAELVLAAAKTPKDIEIYGDLVMKAYKARQLHLPDPLQIPKELYDKPIKIYSLNPKQIKLPDIDRNALAREIDALPETETNKKRWKQEAMIEEVDFIEMLNDQTEDN